MLLIKKLLHLDGFSLPEVLVALGVMSSISLVTMKMVGDQVANEAYVKTNAEIVKVVSLIQTNINNPTRCQEMFGSKGIGGSVSPLAVAIKPGEQKILLAEGSYQNFDVTDISLSSSSISNTVVDLNLTFMVKRKGIMSLLNSTGTRIIKRIPFVVKKNAGGTAIVQCGPAIGDSNDAARSTICESLGANAAWDAGSGRCLIHNMKCAWGEVPEMVTSLGHVACRKISEKLKLEEIFGTSATNCTSKTTLEIRYDTASKKLILTCP